MSKVALVKCDSYDSKNVFEAVKRAVMLLGGPEELVSGKKILLKPNLLSAKDPEKAVTTNPAVFEAVIKVFANDNKELFYGDSPGFGSPKKVAQKTGIFDIGEKYGLKMGDFTTGKTVSFPEGRTCKNFEIAAAALEADSVINICKMKTHQLTKITGAVKNSLGLVYGLNKAGFHAKYPDALSFSRMLIDLNLLLKPALHIMDGVIAMEGNGPGAGDPRHMGVIIASKDPVAVDSLFCKLIDLDPEYVPTNVFGQSEGLGFMNDLEILGDDPEEFITKDFNIVRRPVKSESFSKLRFLKPLILRKPYIEAQKCVKCGICIEACPVEPKALSYKKGKENPPVYDYGKCIRCYCCQEMCPQKAIDVKTPLFGKWFVYK